MHTSRACHPKMRRDVAFGWFSYSTLSYSHLKMPSFVNVYVSFHTFLSTSHSPSLLGSLLHAYEQSMSSEDEEGCGIWLVLLFNSFIFTPENAFICQCLCVISHLSLYFSLSLIVRFTITCIRAEHVIRR